MKERMCVVLVKRCRRFILVCWSTVLNIGMVLASVIQLKLPTLVASGWASIRRAKVDERWRVERYSQICIGQFCPIHVAGRLLGCIMSTDTRWETLPQWSPIPEAVWRAPHQSLGDPTWQAGKAMNHCPGLSSLEVSSPEDSKNV